MPERPQLADQLVDYPTHGREVVFRGAVWDVCRETVDLPEAAGLTRDFVDHTGAVGIAAVDDDDRILLIQQYRHPVRQRDWEIPAGLLDVQGEDPLLAAQRELSEEADLQAGSWAVLADQLSSPGGLSEVLRIYLARDLAADASDFVREGEEAGLVLRWTPLGEAFEAVREGRIGNATAQLAILHAHASRAGGWSGLRPADCAWPAYRHLHG
ncbi:NUDIX hydrolase [Brevibacterium sp. HMSC24B04]|uniref:NUDIX domain-containing protein n=1 Tax=Brevibacterium sp. HMSC24B04 TaxID=1581060 RepID=UPI0008A53D52|nr:NUDIX hydrolase [Brevibacterium sp. HMSC24B04]OFT91487.1 ADP-ribose pyrophosphatase [Brevibacterium sp. HMSC24B04]